MCVLLVEDEPFIREVMAEALQDAGYEVLCVSDGHQAIAALERPSPEFTVILTDLQMPGGVDGFGVAARARELHPDIPVIVATGRPDALHGQWRAEQGYQLLLKPYLPSQMVKVVETLLRKPKQNSR